MSLLLLFPLEIEDPSPQISGECLGEAFCFMAGASITTIIQPVMGGLPVQDTDYFQLLVNGILINLSTTSRFNLGKLNVSYDGKSLSFSEVATPVFTSQTFHLDDSVWLGMLYQGLTSGNTIYTIFTGKIRHIEHRGVNNQEAINYVAQGTQVLANEIQLKLDGYPYISMGGTYLTWINSYLGHPGTYQQMAYPVSQAMTDIFSIMASELTAYGIPSTFGYPGPNQLEGILPEVTEFQNTNLIDAAKKLMTGDPSRKIFFDDITQTWIFPDILNCNIYDLQVNSINLESLIYSEDLANRYTAIRMIAKWDTKAAFPNQETLVCSPDWIPALELDWTLDKACGKVDAEEPNDDYSWVYRKWKFQVSGSGSKQKHPMQPPIAYALIDYQGNLKYFPIDAIIDWPSQLVVTKVPLVVHGNAFELQADPDTGDLRSNALGPLAVVLAYTDMKQIPLTLFPSLRYPEVGFQGTAYTQEGVAREKVEIVDLGELSYYNAASKLAVLQDIIIAGSLPLGGDPMIELMNLQARIRVKHISKATGLETIPALYTGYTYDFGKRGKNIITISTDKSAYVWSK